MAVATHLVDTSALNRLGRPAVEAVLVPLLDRGLVATCGVLNLEALFSAQSPSEYVQIALWRNSIMEYLETDERDFERAQTVQAELATTSMHRAVSLPDLLIAAVAERNRLTLLHYDQDYEYIASVTGQSSQWVVEKGTVA